MTGESHTHRAWLAHALMVLEHLHQLRTAADAHLANLITRNAGRSQIEGTQGWIVRLDDAIAHGERLIDDVDARQRGVGEAVAAAGGVDEVAQDKRYYDETSAIRQDMTGMDHDPEDERGVGHREQEGNAMRPGEKVIAAAPGDRVGVGEVRRVAPDGTVEVSWPDGSRDTNLPASQLLSLDSEEGRAEHMRRGREWLAERNRREINKHVADGKGNYLGQIVDGSIETGRWIVRRPDGSTREYPGPELIETQPPGAPGGPDSDEPSLCRDEPEWLMPIDSRGNTTPRRLRVYESADGTVTAVVTERGPGMSVTNAAEHAHAALIAEFGTAYPGRPVRVVEHYPPTEATSGADEFSEITVSPAGTPEWRHIPREDMVALCGPAVLDDMPPLPPDPDHGHAPVRDPADPAPPTGAGLPDEAVIRGYPAAEPGGRTVMIELPDGEVAPLPHHVKHSPDGFNWGYEGSGSGDLARCILIATLGDRARCPACDGTGQVTYVDGTATPYDSDRHTPEDAIQCGACDRGIAVDPRLYQAFKRDFVAFWRPSGQWAITAGQVRAWLAGGDAR